MHKFISGTLLLVLFTLVACTKNVYEPALPNKPEVSTASLTPSASFDWETARKVAFRIGIKSAQFPDALHSVKIYNGDPVLGNAIVSGSANNFNAFEAQVMLPVDVSGVYLVCLSPNSKSTTQKLIIGLSGVVTAQVAFN